MEEFSLYLVGHGLGGTLALDLALLDLMAASQSDGSTQALTMTAALSPRLNIAQELERSSSLTLSNPTLRQVASSLWPDLTTDYLPSTNLLCVFLTAWLIGLCSQIIGALMIPCATPKPL